ncbi:hypothetical protein [Amycolatopsis decaplanina]|uniref:hypothetical protein n=1 Tax=Amycolatopsis decaplanina TaxID=208441 RepID=UPI001F3F54E0|nr:hypothetical protein [Amycolatopsis decaplanina]
MAAALTLLVTGCGTRTGATVEDRGGELALAAPFTDALALAEASKQETRKAKSFKATISRVSGATKRESTMAARYDDDASKISVTTPGIGETLEMRVVGRILYFKLPAAERARLLALIPWGRLYVDGPDPRTKVLTETLSKSIEKDSPAKQLELVEKTGSILKSEQARLGGVPVNHYFVEFDVKKQLDLFLGDEVPADRRAEIEKRLASEDLRVPAELWVNAEQLPLKMTMDRTGLRNAMGGPDTGEAEWTYTYSDWGAPVEITLPSAADVIDYTILLDRAGF